MSVINIIMTLFITYDNKTIMRSKCKDCAIKIRFFSSFAKKLESPFPGCLYGQRQD